MRVFNAERTHSNALPCRARTMSCFQIASWCRLRVIAPPPPLQPLERSQIKPNRTDVLRIHRARERLALIHARGACVRTPVFGMHRFAVPGPPRRSHPKHSRSCAASKAANVRGSAALSGESVPGGMPQSRISCASSERSRLGSHRTGRYCRGYQHQIAHG